MKPKLRVLVCGDRNWTDEKTIRTVLNHYRKRIDQVVEGEAKGADLIAWAAAVDNHIPVKPFYADWTRFGKAAGPIRNREMLGYLSELPREQCLVLAFHPDLKKSKGTRDMVYIANKVGIATWVYPRDSFRHLSEIVDRLTK